jgi:hypothetical protein
MRMSVPMPMYMAEHVPHLAVGKTAYPSDDCTVPVTPPASCCASHTAA